MIRARKVVTDHIQTKSIEIGGMRIGKTIQTTHGDIGYHFKLEDEDVLFEEGEVVGFLPDEANNGKYMITKLNSKNSSGAILKGVITRSQYFEAQKPVDDNGKFYLDSCIFISSRM